MSIDPRIKELIKQLILKAMSQKVETNLIAEKADIDRSLLKKASGIVQLKVTRILDTITEFNPDLLLSKIPSLEFLELLVVSEYLYLCSVEAGNQDSMLRGDTDVIAAFTAILKAYDIHRPEELEVYRGLWKEIWSNSPRGDSQADKAFEELKEVLASSSAANPYGFAANK